MGILTLTSEHILGSNIRRVTMRYFVLFYAITCLFLIGCTRQQSHTIFEIGKDYVLLHSSGETKIVSKDENTHASQSIPSDVTHLAWNENYIIATQIPKPVVLNHPDASISNDNRIHVWIIDMIHNKRIGPFTKEEFEIKKKEFHIPSMPLLEIERYFK